MSAGSSAFRCTVRLARQEELDVVFDLVRAATRAMEALGIAQWDEIYPDKDILRQDLVHCELHVAEAAGSIVGIVAINEVQSPEYGEVIWRFSGRVLVVHRLTVHPASQRQGIAARLMSFVEEFAVVNGYETIRLDAFTHNPAACNLYERRGYRKAGTVRFRKGEFFCYEKPVI